jgi:hypothetical protein
VVQLAAHGAQAGFDVAETLAVGQLSKGHRQILVAAGEAPMVRISAIAFDTLLELVGRQVIQELGEDGMSGVHPSLLTIGAASGHPALAPGSAAINFKSKNESYTLSHVICVRYSEQLDFSRTPLIYHIGLPLDEPIRVAKRNIELSVDDVKAAFSRQVRIDDFVQVVRGPVPSRSSDYTGSLRAFTMAQGRIS